ncbi:methyl-accepting chemotaxis protein [Alteromonas sp. KUL49]|uniref:methyl-accepting chemotaxis protein n=1 Tax=Alteromonas sp. KUL49 TaxID=2480798 RepID=UPI00102EF177|nr:methyl-accepting chemotaxis protein [Alteromonas sp. KUL49]TAP41239.1 chemotaxis protein [Alteromonas sp. KUL49]GEA10288.1 methyl-accepting chemotaxis protein [Alteromonas sp. KUL49]
MRQFIRNVSLVKFTLISTGILLLLLAILVSKGMYQAFQARAQAASDTYLIAVIDAVEKIAHNHAVERGLTAGFLGNPTDAAFDKVRGQRTKADASVNALNALLRDPLADELQLSVEFRPLFQIIEGKDALRAQVNNKQGAAAFGFYSNLNATAIATATSLMLYVNDVQAKASLSQAILFARLKERLGQFRGKTNGVLAKKVLAPAVEEELKFYVSEIALLQSQLTDKLQGDIKSQFSSVMSSSTSREIADISATLTSGNPNFNGLPSSGEWFPLATKQIGDVKGLLDKTWVDIGVIAAKTRSGASTLVAVNIILIVISASVLIILYYVLNSVLRKQLKSLTDKLDQISESGDLTIDVKLTSQNELGVISQSIGKTVMALTDLIVGLSQSIQVSSLLSEELSKSTVVMLKDAGNTQQKASNIATAIEEMSVTSSEIARGAVETLDASKQLDQLSVNTIEANDKTGDAMVRLHTEMQDVEKSVAAMEKQVTEITSILDTINTLSDQTNLLALNAAIEAARAGEHGRGFAVVADEVRKLASASRASSDQISTLLSSLQQANIDVVEGVSRNAEFAKSIVDITKEGEVNAKQAQDAAVLVESLANTSSASAEQQAVTSMEVAKDILSVQEASEHEVEIAKNLAELAEKMKDNNDMLKRTMANFTFAEPE